MCGDLAGAGKTLTGDGMDSGEDGVEKNGKRQR